MTISHYLSADDNEPTSVGLIVGSVFGGVSLLIIIIVLVLLVLVCIRKSQKKLKYSVNAEVFNNAYKRKYTALLVRHILAYSICSPYVVNVHYLNIISSQITKHLLFVLLKKCMRPLLLVYYSHRY